MKASKLWATLLTFTAVAASANGAVITVTTAASSGAGSLAAALAGVQSGDVIGFNIPGAGPHYIETPAGGYPYITAANVTIDGYTQPGAVANSNTILSSNNAQIKIVLDSRNGNTTLMNYPGDTPNDDTGYGDTESAILGVLGVTNFTVRGVAMLAVPLTGTAGDVAVYGVSFAKGGNGHIAGCWIGVDPVTKQTATGIAPADAVTGFRYRGRDENNVTTNTILVSGVTIGVGKNASNARAEFNVIAGVPAIPVILEGENHRISGNFIGVLPDGKSDFNVGLDPVLTGNFEGFIEIGRAGNNVLIGVDGDGVNDAEERNVFGGTVSPAQGGYDHSLEFYGQTPGTNIVVAGNYIGVGVDGTTRFTNNVPPLNAAGGSSTYRFGSDFDGVSDQYEGNVVYNNWPADMLTDAVLSFFDELAVTGVASVRGNTLVNNYTPPVDPLKGAGDFFTNYYSRVMADTNAAMVPVLGTNSTVTRLKGTVPVATAGWSNVVVDVYVVDAEGIATGKAVDSTLYPEGWVQGKTYLGSFPVTSADGSFDADISGLAVPLNTPLTIAATYSASPAGTHNALGITSLFAVPVAVKAGSTAPTITSVAVSGANLIINWSGGTPPYQLQKRANLNTGTLWVNEGAPSESTTATIPVSGSQYYFQVLGQ